MNALLPWLYELTVRLLLRAYPPPFRARFQGEMLHVYRSLAAEVGQGAGGGLPRLWLRVIWDGLTSVVSQWGQYLQSQWMAGMNLNPGDVEDGAAPLRPLGALLAAFPFVLWGLANIAMKLGVGQAQVGTPLGMMLSTHPYLLFNWLILLGLAAGALCGFPRWSQVYVGWAVLDAAWWTNLNFYGQYTRISVFFLNLMCLPLAAAVLIPLIARLRLRPARILMLGGWRDLTLPALALYLFFGTVYASYDENHHPALLLFVAATSAALALGAWGYYRSAAPLRRALALTGGLAAAAVLEIWNRLTWDWAAYYGFLPLPPLQEITAGLTAAGVMAALLLGNGLLAEWVRKRLAW